MSGVHAAMSVGVSLDVPTVGTYSVQEDTPEGQIQVCAVANASVQNDAVVTIRTLPSTATCKIRTHLILLCMMLHSRSPPSGLVERDIGLSVPHKQ